MPSRTLNWAIDLRARRMLGFCPVIVPSCSVAASRILESVLASPQPMLTVTLTMRGACMGVVYPNRSTRAGRISSLYRVFSRAVVGEAVAMACVVLVQSGAAALRDAQALAVLDLDSDPGRLAVLGIDQHHIRHVDRPFALDHARSEE